jgi:hypothetical protein
VTTSIRCGSSPHSRDAPSNLTPPKRSDCCTRFPFSRK